MRETGKDGYQSKLIKAIKKTFPGAIVLKNNANLNPGIPDLTVLYEDHWCAIEVKASAKATYRPGQEHYLEKMKNMSCSFTAYPENHEDVIDGLQQAFQPDGRPRLPERK